MMKKNLLYAMILLAAIACNKEVIDNTPAVSLAEGETTVHLTGRITPPTKVEFDDTYGRFTWTSPADEIAIHVTAGLRGEVEMIPTCYKKAAAVPNADPSTCDFFFVMSEGQTRDFYAVYPASVVDEENYGDPNLIINLPSSYDIAPTGMGDYCPTPMLAINDPSESYLDFRHLGGLLRLQLNDVSPETASIEVSLGKGITGSFMVNDPGTPVPYVVAKEEPDVLTYTLTEPLADYTSGLLLNVPVPTGTYNVLNVKAKNEAGSIVFTYEDETIRSFYAGRGYHAETSISAVTIPLFLEAVEDGEVGIINPNNYTFEYSYDNKHWQSVTTDEDFYITAEAGQRVYLRGNHETYHEEGISFNDFRINTNGQFYVAGNVMSLIDATNFEDLTEFTREYALGLLFYGASEILSHPGMSLNMPATTLTVGCYVGMFLGCASLTEAPALPATTLVPGCYWMMFGGSGLTRSVEVNADEIPQQAMAGMYSGCANLAYAPDLPATVVMESGYASMFSDCSSLVTPPVISATTIGKSAMSNMFEDCSSLESVPELLAPTLAESCYEDMFNGCTSLVTVPEDLLPVMDLAESCYSGMFSECSSLTNAPKLPALVMVRNCYDRMFSKCTSLTTAPDLPATELAEYCYSYMFNGCTSLNYIKVLGCPPFSNAAGGPTNWWVENVPAGGTFVKNPNATWSSGKHGVPVGWTVENASE